MLPTLGHAPELPQPQEVTWGPERPQGQPWGSRLCCSVSLPQAVGSRTARAASSWPVLPALAGPGGWMLRGRRGPPTGSLGLRAPSGGQWRCRPGRLCGEAARQHRASVPGARQGRTLRRRHSQALRLAGALGGPAGMREEGADDRVHPSLQTRTKREPFA